MTIAAQVRRTLLVGLIVSIATSTVVFAGKGNDKQGQAHLLGTSRDRHAHGLASARS